MTIEFQCPECFQTLRTHDERAGASAKCPNCGSSITVPQANSVVDTSSDPWEDVQADEFSSNVSERTATSSSSVDSIACAVCGEQNPDSFRNCRACGEPLTGDSYRVPIRRKEVHVGFVLSETWEIYQKNLGMTIAAVMIPFAIIAGISLVLFIIAAIAAEADETVAGLIVMAGMLPLILVQIYLWLGSSKMLLKIARGQSVEVADLFAVGRYFTRAVMICLVIGFLLTVVAGFIVALFAMAFMSGRDSAFLIILLSIGLLLLFGMLFKILIWPFWYVLIDRDEPGLGALLTTFSLFKFHVLASLICIVLGGFINQVGGMFCYVGVVFTMPYVELLLTVAYCQLMGYKTAARMM